MTFEYYYMGTQNQTYKIISREDFHSSSKSTKTMKVFSHLTFVVYSICNIIALIAL